MQLNHLLNYMGGDIMKNEKLPNFLIVGTRKGGTSPLQKYLRNHPDIFMARGEIYFFSDEENYAKGVKWYEQFFSECKNEKMIGEKSNPYMCKEKAAKRIYNLIPKVKLIFILRHPIDRAYSGYWQNIRSAKTFCSFKAAIENNCEEYCQKSFMEVSRYKEQIACFREFFPKKQLLLLKSDDLKDDRKRTLEKVFNFLGVKNIIPDNINKEYNVGVDPRRFNLLHKKINNMDATYNFKEAKTSIKYIPKILNTLNTRRGLVKAIAHLSANPYEWKTKYKGAYPKMNADVRRKLEKILEEKMDY